MLRANILNAFNIYQVSTPPAHAQGAKGVDNHMVVSFPLEEVKPDILFGKIAQFLPNKDREILRLNYPLKKNLKKEPILPFNHHFSLHVEQAVSSIKKANDILQKATLTSVTPQDYTLDQPKFHYVNFSIKNDLENKFFTLRVTCHANSPDEAVTTAKESLKKVFRAGEMLLQRKETFAYSGPFRSLNPV